MRETLMCVRIALLAAVLAGAAACASDESAGADASDGGLPAAEVSEAEAVHGEVSVVWENLDPRNPPAVRGLVNESSERGQRLRSGRETSTEWRVLTDAQMGWLLGELRNVGFYANATEGVGLDNLPDAQGRKGAVVVNENGASRALVYALGVGPGAFANAYVESKRRVLAAHSSAEGLSVTAGTGESSERIFSVPPPRLKRP